jgi:hypothetical protein
MNEMKSLNKVGINKENLIIQQRRADNNLENGAFAR